MAYLHDASALEQVDRLAISKGIRESWYAPIWVDFQEPRLLLSAISCKCQQTVTMDCQYECLLFGDINFGMFIWKSV